MKNTGCRCIYGERLEAVKAFIYLGVGLNLGRMEETKGKHENERKTIMR